MSKAELIGFVAVLSIGVYLFLKARGFGKNQKKQFESGALDRLNRSLNKLEGGKHSYEYYTRQASSNAEWRKVDLGTMEKDIVSDCTRSTPEGDHYGKSRYAMRSTSDKKAVYYVAGVAKYEFSGIERKAS